MGSRRRGATVARILAVYAVVLLILGAWVTFGTLPADGWWQIPFFSVSALVALLIWVMLPWTNWFSRYTSFGACMLIAWILNRIVWILDFVLSGERFSSWPIYPMQAAQHVIKAEVVTVTGTIITILAWYLVGGTNWFTSSRKAGSGTDDGRPLFQAVYFLSLLALLVKVFVPIPSVLQSPISWVRYAGFAAQLFLGLTDQGSAGKAIGRQMVLTAPLLMVSLTSAMKEEVIVALLPLAIVVFRRTTSNLGRVLLAGCAVVGLSYLSAYNAFFRLNLTWGQDKANEIVGDFLEYSTGDGFSELILAGAETFLFRANAGNYRGYAVAIADNEGYKPELVFRPVLYSVVPRLIWPDKPRNLQAAEYNAMVLGNDRSSLSAGLYTGAYLGAGWFGMLAVAVVLGVIVGAMQHLAWTTGGTLLYLLYTGALFPSSIRIDEAWVGDAISGVASGLLYVGVVFSIAKGIMHGRRTRSGRSALGG